MEEKIIDEIENNEISDIHIYNYEALLKDINNLGGGSVEYYNEAKDLLNAKKLEMLMKKINVEREKNILHHYTEARMKIINDIKRDASEIYSRMMPSGQERVKQNYNQIMNDQLNNERPIS